MSFLENFNKKQESVTLTETLFKEEAITYMSFSMFKRGYVSSGEASHYWKGSVDFKKGDLSGSKEFKVEGKDGMIELVKQMNDFIVSLQ